MARRLSSSMRSAGYCPGVAVTALAEACADLKPLLPILEDLITEPDTQARAGHTKPGSRIPGNSGVLAIIGDVDRKSTRLNSSHQIISYAVFCLKKKKTTKS